ncbi:MULTISPECIES: efflux pump antibiotic resistance protein [Frankia]|uniref:Efflux pump antibiotic resistance protein (Partial) n=1 Tax=Frankia alni (strain DSM 45986 / CECT 9034 / ACN14a) TaxID=326424 RepID=Q0RE38_FRAAA|nr:Efflux pump antibiotic resistance protein (partial) [Frankia alni ACN14a]
MGIAGPIGGRLADRAGSRPVAVAGAALTTVGLVLLAPLGTAWSPAEVAVRLALAGTGMGLYGGRRRRW